MESFDPESLGTDSTISAPCEFEVCYLWRGHLSHELEPVQIIAHAIEQPLTPVPSLVANQKVPGRSSLITITLDA